MVWPLSSLLPHIGKLRDELGPEGFEVLAINVRH